MYPYWWYCDVIWTFTNDMELDTLKQKRQNRTAWNLAWSCQCIRFSSAPLTFSTSLARLGKSYWNTSIQPSWNLPLTTPHQVEGTWDSHYDGVCDFPNSFRSGHGTLITRCSEYVEKSDDKWISDSSSFQSFCGRHHYSRPVPNRCRCTKVLWLFHIGENEG